MRPDALPPARLLDHDGVREAHAAWCEATARHDQVRRDRLHAEQVELHNAIERDRAADVKPIAADKPLPKAKAAEQKLREQIEELARAETASATIQAQVHTALLETLNAEQATLAEQAAKRNADAETEFAEAVGALESAAAKLAEVRALTSWAAAPTERAYKQRGVMVPIPRHSDSEPPLDAVTGALRELIKPKPAPAPVEPQAIPASMVANRTPD